MTQQAEPVGRKLQKAREARNLTLEEAALETRIRASQLSALEADDYAAFPSNTYARGFLLIYGKFLAVDVREVARNLEGTNPISIAEYQYLNAYPEAEPQRDAPRRRDEPRTRRPSLVPLIVFVLLLGAGALGVHLYLQAQRLESTDTKSPAGSIESVTPRTAGETPLVQPVPATTTIVPANPTPQPFNAPRAPENDRAFLGAKPPAPTPLAPVAAPPIPATVAATPTPVAAMNELTVEPIKKTHIRIVRDDPKAEPIFDDVLYPKVGALKLKGVRFFIEIQEADAVTLRKNGQSIAYQPGSITVQ